MEKRALQIKINHLITYLMKRFLFVLLAFSMVPISGFAQKKKTKLEHPVVFHLSTGDTAAYTALTVQLNNVLNYWPKASIEVVVHNNGIAFMQKSVSKHAAAIQALADRGVVFAVCENTMKRKKLEKSHIFEAAQFVPVGLAEIILKQEQGWSYIKSGF